MNPKEMIAASLNKLKDLYWQREEIEWEMGKQHLAVRGLLNLVEDRAEREAYKALLDHFRVRTGLSELVRLALKTFDKPLTPVEIRNFVRNYGSDASEQQNLLQSIHTTLKRMDDEVTEVVNEDGDKAYKFIGIGERIVRAARNIDADNANRIGQRAENRFLKTLTPEQAEKIRERMREHANQAYDSLFPKGKK